MQAIRDEEFERKFDAGENIAEYIDGSLASRSNQARPTLRRFDEANYIETADDVVAYLDVVLEENDVAAL